MVASWVGTMVDLTVESRAAQKAVWWGHWLAAPRVARSVDMSAVSLAVKRAAPWADN